VVVYYVQYNLDSWQISGDHCWYKPDYRSPHNVSGYVPTTMQEWRTATNPIVNPSGVVPSQYPSVPATDIHAGSVVTLYGIARVRS
jgi:hypothetical protein